MATKITRQILEAYLYCKTKAHLKLAGQQGHVSDYEAMLISNRQAVRQQAIDRILARTPEHELARDVPLTAATLLAGSSFILNVILEDDLFSLSFDGLKRVEGPSKLGDFHYAPMLFWESRKVGKEQRLLLELFGLLLSRLQGQMPSSGIIWHGKDCRTTRVRLNGDLRKTEHMLREMKETVNAESPPKLILNDHCQVCEFRQRCHDQAVQEDNISLLRGMGEKEVRSCARKGIFTITQLSHTFRPRRRHSSPQRLATGRYHALSALAIRDHAIYIIARPPAFSGQTSAYFDVESNPEEGYVYLIGLVVVQGDHEHRCSFWADDYDEESQIFDLLLDELERLGEFTLLCYGSYEKTFLQRMRKQTTRKELVDRAITSLVNVLSVIYKHVYFCTYSNGLKDIGRLLGADWTDDATAIQSIEWRKKWQSSRDDCWKAKILTYNIEDCLALMRVTQFIEVAAEGASTDHRSSLPEANGVKVTLVEDIDRARATSRWGLSKFVLSDFQFVSRCSYFDYQRERVHIRTSPILRARKATRKSGRTNKRLPVNRDSIIVNTTCPVCSGTDLELNTKKIPGTMQAGHKRAYDLAVTPSGLRRKTILVRAPRHHCRSCHAIFIPASYRNLDKHFHNLKCVSMYLHIAHQLSFKHLEALFLDLFGLNVCGNEFMTFRTLLARKYGITAESLLSRILSGAVIHIDETEVTLKGEKGYVWVITSIDEVYYIYRPNREGAFLRELLKDFRGVVVSDFYGAYDALPNCQQKCVLHLMRDMNQLILNNPFDEELQAITRPFGTLLRSIIMTVDKHGLRRKFLEAHGAEVTALGDLLGRQSFSSDAAESLRERLLKCWDRLFTFIHHDGVSWNNNYAENAIRYFAYYREKVKGIMTIEGLQEYLILLSVFETCRYRGISFLKFLVSRETDLVGYRERKKPKLGRPLLETFPEGYIPAHYAKLVERQKRRLSEAGDGEELPTKSGENNNG
jgi:predicted RecB family nuclease